MICLAILIELQLVTDRHTDILPQHTLGKHNAMQITSVVIAVFLLIKHLGVHWFQHKLQTLTINYFKTKVSPTIYYEQISCHKLIAHKQQLQERTAATSSIVFIMTLRAPSH